VGKDEHLRLFESLMDLEVSSIRQGVLMKMGSIDLIIRDDFKDGNLF
jgi:hypothetical protein